MNVGKQGAGQVLLFQLLHEISKLSTEAHERGVLYIDEKKIAAQLGIRNVFDRFANISTAPIKHSAIDAIASYTATPSARISAYASSDSIPSTKTLEDAVQSARDYSLASVDKIGQRNCGQISASFALVHSTNLYYSSIGSNPIVAFSVDKKTKRTSVTLINQLDFPGEMPPAEVRNVRKLDPPKFSTIITLENVTTSQIQQLGYQDFLDLYNALVKRGLLKADTYPYLTTGNGKYWVSDDLIHAIEKELLRTNFTIQVIQLYNQQHCTQFFLNSEAKENRGEWKYSENTLCVGIFDSRIIQNSIHKTLSYLNSIFSYCIASNEGRFDLIRLQSTFDTFFFGATSMLFTINNTKGTFFLSLFKGEKVPFLVAMGADPAEEATNKLKAALPSIFSKTEFFDLQKQSSTAAAGAGAGAATTTATTVDMSASTLSQLDDFILLDGDKSAVASK